jgi:hypothetical protein
MEKDNNMMLDIFVFHLTISYWLSFSINPYLHNMILPEETLRPLAACYCPSLIHTCTIHIVQVSINGEEQKYAAGYLSVSSDSIVLYRCALMEKNNTNISSIILSSFSMNTYLYNIGLSEDTIRYPSTYYIPRNKRMLLDTLVFLVTTAYCTCMY